MPAKGYFKTDLAGRRFGFWTVLHRTESHARYDRYWLCRCDCGTERLVLGPNLTRGLTHSCGCERNKASVLRATIHGRSNTPEYRAWSCMRTRCLNPNSTQYSHYGGRGITICERWLKFEHFLEDMGSRPSSKHSIDRIDVDGDYEPPNCRWATKTQQMHNQRRSHFLTLGARTLTLSEWSLETGIGHTAILYRLRKGWSVEDALTRPVK